MSQKILVTGAAGFIGRRICISLVELGHDVIAWDGFVEGLYSSLRKRVSAQNLSRSHAVNVQEIDLRSSSLLIPAGVTSIIHAAAMPGLSYSWDNYKDYAECNLVATHNLVEASVNSEVQKFVHLSTSSVYGREADGNEGSPIGPVSPYGITKLGSEQTISAVSEAFGPIDYSIVRLFSVYGPWQRPDMAYFRFIDAVLRNDLITIYGDGRQMRSNTFVDDATDGVVRAMLHGGAGETYNIGGGENIKLLDAVRIIGEEIGVEPKLSFEDAVSGDQRITSANIEKASRELGYEPETSFRDGIKKQIEWQKNQGTL